MALWVVRAGSQGEYLQRFFDRSEVYITWDGLDRNLAALDKQPELTSLLSDVYPEAKPGAVRNWAGQLWPFVKTMAVGDWVVVPNGAKRTMNVAEIRGDYIFDPKAEDPYFHHREVSWIAKDVPRTVFPQDILYSLGAYLTIFRVSRNDAENRVRAMASNGWKPEAASALIDAPGAPGEGAGSVDLQQIADDHIARLIMARFKGHGLARLVEVTGPRLSVHSL